jgi:hypothetical protein
MSAPARGKIRKRQELAADMSDILKEAEREKLLFFFFFFFFPLTRVLLILARHPVNGWMHRLSLKSLHKQSLHRRCNITRSSNASTKDGNTHQYSHQILACNSSLTSGFSKKFDFLL